MEINECYSLGVITKTHGLQGNVTVKFEAENFEEYSEMESVFLEIQGKLVPFFISSISISNRGTAIVKFDYIDDIDQAKEIVGAQLHLPLDCKPELLDSEYYFQQLIGYNVSDSEKGALGIIEDIIEYPKNQLFKINHNGIEILVPVSEDFITELDKNNKTVTLTLPDGLLDLYL